MVSSDGGFYVSEFNLAFTKYLQWQNCTILSICPNFYFHLNFNFNFRVIYALNCFRLLIIFTWFFFSVCVLVWVCKPKLWNDRRRQMMFIFKWSLIMYSISLNIVSVFVVAVCCYSIAHIIFCLSPFFFSLHSFHCWLYVLCGRALVSHTTNFNSTSK